MFVLFIVDRENRLLEDDLTNMTAETQRLNKDIKELIDERAELSDQVQDYIGEVKRVEDVLAQKVATMFSRFSLHA